MTVGSASMRAAAAALLGLAAWPCPAQQLAERVPPELQGVDVVEKLDAQLPLDAQFFDETGKPVRLGDYFTGKKPVVLTLNYYGCPMLCGLVLNAMVDGLRPLDWTPGKEFELVTVSFDPLEGADLAKAKKQTYLEYYGRPGAGAGWHFLTGKREHIKALTEACGFGYRWNDERKEWAHPAALILCTPKGRISRYLGGVYFDSNTLRFSLVEASQGKVGSLFDQLFLTCFHYSPSEGRYVPTVLGIMKTAGGATLLILGLVLTSYWRLEARRRRAGAAQVALHTGAHSL